jgi:hypothetical protein
MQDRKAAGAPPRVPPEITGAELQNLLCQHGWSAQQRSGGSHRGLVFPRTGKRLSTRQGALRGNLLHGVLLDYATAMEMTKTELINLLWGSGQCRSDQNPQWENKDKDKDNDDEPIKGAVNADWSQAKKQKQTEKELNDL